MEHLADGAQPTAIRDRSTADLVKLLSEQVSVLVRDELKLTQLEMTRKGKEAGAGAGMMGGGGLLALYGVACLIACAVIAIAGVIPAWLAALIVGVALLAVAAVAALLGKRRVQKAVPPVPEESVARIKTDVDVIRQRTHR
jgi:Flp pilus assembly protein TadB